MTDDKEPSGAEKMFGDSAPALVGFYAGWPKAMAAVAVAEQVFPTG
jgi:alkylhydroperoxidase/carboxymuconolactone decarboxylase family protein YurZ